MIKKLLLVLLIWFFCIGAYHTKVFCADNTKAVTITTSATEIVPLKQDRQILMIYNNGSATVFLGFTAADCTTTTALPLTPGSYVKLKDKADSIYGIVASGTVEVRVWEDQGR